MTFKQFIMESMTESPEFKQWFAGSKVADRRGRPLLVYHGTQNKFQHFDMKFIGANNRRVALDMLGFWFSKERGSAEGYANLEKPLVMKAYLSIKNPYYMDEDEFYDLTNEGWEEGKALLQTMKASGKDGVVAETGEGLNYCVFSTSQIRVAG